MHKATITLHGTVDDPEIPIYGAKVRCDLYPNTASYNYFVTCRYWLSDKVNWIFMAGPEI